MNNSTSLLTPKLPYFCSIINHSQFKKMRTIYLLFCIALSFSLSAKDQPNILFIEVDDLNYEYLSSFGSQLVQTPNVDRLAQTGVRFENAMAQGMMCGPSRNSLMTGLYPHNLGFYYNGDLNAIPKDTWSLPLGLKEAGYYNAWIGKSHIRPKGKDKAEGMKQQMGFDMVKQTQGRVVLTRNVKRDPAFADKDWYLQFLKEKDLVDHFAKEYPGISTMPEEAYLDAFFTSETIDFLQHYKEDKPFFLWVNYSVPHGPNDVIQKYHDPYHADEMPGSTKPDFNTPQQLVKKTTFSEKEELHQEEQAGHCAMVDFMDHQVERLLATLTEQGLMDNTVIVFFSDHGIMLGDHQRQHKGTLFRQITNPALIISYPAAFEQGTVNHSPVELIDLVNSTLDIAQAPKSALKERPHSQSLVPILKGETTQVRDVAFGEVEGYVVASDGHYRLIEGADASLLFDDQKDPKNLHNIASEHPEIVKQLSQKINLWFKETGSPLPANTY